MNPDNGEDRAYYMLAHHRRDVLSERGHLEGIHRKVRLECFPFALLAYHTDPLVLYIRFLDVRDMFIYSL